MEESLNLLNGITRTEHTAADQYSPLTLAYLGDAVFELYVRARLVGAADVQADKLHKRAIQYVSAPAQAKMAAVIEPMLTEKEQKIYKRGRNGKPHSIAKNASVSDYLKATGFETLIGYLYLSGETGRLNEILEKALEGGL